MSHGVKRCLDEGSQALNRVADKLGQMHVNYDVQAALTDLHAAQLWYAEAIDTFEKRLAALEATSTPTSA